MESRIRYSCCDQDVFWDKLPEWDLKGGIHVWKVNCSSYNPQMMQWLTVKEKIKMSNFLRLEDKNRFLYSKALSKLLISKYLDIPIHDLEIEVGVNGKPFLRDTDSFHFNVSHSGQRLILAFSTGELGVDIELIRPDFDFSNLLTCCFSQTEIAYIQEADIPREAFYRLWTVKESVLKGTGVGLIDNLPELNCLEGERQLLPNLNSYGSEWHNISYRIEDDYAWSLTSKNKPGALKFFEY